MGLCLSKQQKLTKKLKKLEYKDTEKYIPPVTHGKVIKVYDGDTITIGTYIHNINEPYRFSVRLAGIDAPELRTNDELEKKYGYKVRDKLAEKIFNKIVILTDVSTEKYGRILATVRLVNEKTTINDWMLQNKYAVTYDGGTKKKFHFKDYCKL